MLPSDQLDRISVVLVSPRNPLNIGAVARAMANFGLRHLTAVAPFEPHWREARSAVGAESLLQNARSTQCLAEAVRQCTLVLGTGTLAHRKPEQRVVQLPELAPLVGDELEHGGRVALLFGPEKHGLTRDDLSCCHLLVEIPTHPSQPSMNLGQAAAVCLYELSTRVPAPGPASPVKQDPPATSGSLDALADLIEQTMIASNYSPRLMRPANRHDLRLLLRRLNLRPADLRRALGLFRRILWRLSARAKPNHLPK